MTTKEIGDFGEKAAEDYLVEMDYLILERNRRKGRRTCFCGSKDEKE